MKHQTVQTTCLAQYEGKWFSLGATRKPAIQPGGTDVCNVTQKLGQGSLFENNKMHAGSLQEQCIWSPGSELAS